MEVGPKKQTKISPIVANQIVKQIVEQSIMQGMAKQKLSYNCSQSKKIFGVFLGNFFEQISHTTTILSDKEKIPYNQQIRSNKFDVQPHSICKKQFSVKLSTKYRPLNHRDLSEGSIPSRKTVSSLNRLPVQGISPEAGNENERIVQRKKYFSQHNKRQEKCFVKLKINYQNKRDQEDAHKTQQINQGMRNLKKGFDIITKIRFSELPKAPKVHKNRSISTQDFPLLQNVNPIQYHITKSINNTKTNTLHRQQQNLTNKKQSDSVKIPLKENKLKMQLQRQNQSKNFFEQYHFQPEQQRLHQKQIILQQNCQIKILDDKKLSVSKKSKEKRVLQNNILQANRKSLTMLGARQRRFSNYKISPSELKLPHLKIQLKILPRDKQNCEGKNRLKLGKIQSQVQKIHVKNVMSLNLMLRNEELCVNGYEEVQKESFNPYSEFQYQQKMEDKKDELIKNQNYNGNSNLKMVEQRRLFESEDETDETLTIEELSSIHLGVASRVQPYK